MQRWCSCFLALDQSVAFFPAKGAHLLVLMERRGVPGAEGSKHRLLLADCVTPINPRRETCWSPSRGETMALDHALSGPAYLSSSSSSRRSWTDFQSHRIGSPVCRACQDEEPRTGEKV